MDYMHSMCASDTLSVGDSARATADGLFHIRKMPSTWILSKPARLVTSILLPGRFREAYGLPPPTPARQRQHDRTMRWTRIAFDHLPAHLRYAAPYLEALQRLEGRQRARLPTRFMNRLSLGKPELVLNPRKGCRS